MKHESNYMSNNWLAGLLIELNQLERVIQKVYSPTIFITLVHQATQAIVRHILSKEGLVLWQPLCYTGTSINIKYACCHSHFS